MSSEVNWLLSKAELGECPCGVGTYLHPVLATCPYCNRDRGSALWLLEAKLEAVKNLPSEVVRAAVTDPRVVCPNDLALAKQEPQSADDPRLSYWRLARRAIAYGEHLAFTVAPGKNNGKWNYLGGLPSRPYSEYVLFRYDPSAKRIRLMAERDGSVVADIAVERLISASPIPHADYIKGTGQTYGVGIGNAISFATIPPFKGGAMRLGYVDDDGAVRMLVLGNRTGLTDTVFPFVAFEGWCQALGAAVRSQLANLEWNETPLGYARRIGFKIPERVGAAPVAAETKTCPDCAETVKAAARICHFCRHEFV